MKNKMYFLSLNKFIRFDLTAYNWERLRSHASQLRLDDSEPVTFRIRTMALSSFVVVSLARSTRFDRATAGHTFPPGRGHRVGFHHSAEPPPSPAHGTPLRLRRRQCNQYKDAADPDTGELEHWTHEMKPHTRSPARVVVIGLLLWLATMSTVAAQTTGSIEGAVVDDLSGSPLPGVVVRVVGQGLDQEHVTGTYGSYTAAGLAAGDYVVTAARPGFETVETKVSVRAGTTEMVLIQLRFVFLMEEISVVAEESAHLRAQRRRGPDAAAAVEHHCCDVGGGQPARGLHPGGRRLRVRRLVEQCRRARLPVDHQ